MELTFFLTIDKGRMVVHWNYRNKRKGWRVVVDEKDMASFMAQIIAKFSIKPDECIVMCSSSLDFPEQYTKDPKIIAWANKIRSV